MNKLNKLINQEVKTQYIEKEGLASYLEYLKKIRGWNVTVYDISGYTLSEPYIREILEPYAFHTFPYCSFVKQIGPNNRRCVLNRRIATRKAHREESIYYGKCYMGVGEFVFPVFANGRVIAVGCLGQFCLDIDRELQKIKRQAAKYGMDFKKMKEIYLENTKLLSEQDLEEIIDIISTLSDFISFTFQVFELKKYVDSDLNLDLRPKNLTSNKIIIKQAMNYIEKNYNKTLSLDEIACHINCSCSYLSRLFSDAVGITLTNYINKVRIEHAKGLLDSTDLSIKEVSFSTGFNDSNYFSKVFKDFTGTPPTEFRKRLREQAVYPSHIQ